VYEKSKEREKIPLTKDKAIKNLLLSSKNPNADYNNPTSPFYKGKLANKILENYRG
jgi:hypothetical protein